MLETRIFGIVQEAYAVGKRACHMLIAIANANALLRPSWDVLRIVRIQPETTISTYT